MSPTSCRNPVANSQPLSSNSRSGMAASSSTNANSSSIVNKPARGWLHPDYLFAKDGINYNVRYIGCLEVNTSMKLLDFDTRSLIAKECINRVCESSGLKTVDKKRRPDKKISRMLSETPSMEKAGANVQLTITSLWLKLSDLDSGQALFVHEMPNISFASGGDADTLDFVAYVAKNNNVRSCYVLECGGGLAQDVITTIGQAFELRFKEFLKRTPVSKPPPLQMVPTRTPKPDEVEYYNDLPGKSPPDISGGRRGPQKQERTPRDSNLIDFSTEIPVSGAPEYVNSSVPNPRANINGGASHRDPFDMSPFATQPPGGGMAGLLASAAKIDNLRIQLSREEWFHGPISRKDAESLLKHDGDFLVRESQGSPGQYVLTGMQNNSKKHLLLVDPEGIVRTKDRTFDSVSHLINFHQDNSLPIISAESALRLKTPVPHSRR